MTRLRIASLSIVLEGGRAPLGDLEGFRDPGSGRADLRLAWTASAGPVLPGWRGEAGFEDLPGGRVRFSRTDFLGELDPAAGTGTLATPSPEALRAALRFAVSLALLERGGLLLHAAALERGGRAFVLCGPSGAGKSTAARLSLPEARLLTDELCALVRTPEGWAAFGTPFRGELPAGSPAGAPLAAVALLEQAPEAGLRPLPAADAARRLYPQVFRPSRDPERAGRWLGLLGRLCAERPVAALRFRRDPGFWGPLEELAA